MQAEELQRVKGRLQRVQDRLEELEEAQQEELLKDTPDQTAQDQLEKAMKLRVAVEQQLLLVVGMAGDPA